MRPYPEEVLKALQAGVGAHFAPELSSNYARAQFAFSMLLFMVIQRDYDSAVPDLIEANAALREMLGEASASLATIPRDDARTALRSLSVLPEPAASLRLSALRSENEALKAGVSSIAALVERAADEDELEPLRAVRTKMYAWFAADARKRIVPILSG
jgi:hypothetical protein